MQALLSLLFCSAVLAVTPGHSLITRSEWGAIRSRRPFTAFRRTPTMVVVHHTATPGCSDRSSCDARVRSIQNTHRNKKRWNDIGYNFLIAPSGNVYEGRGSDYVGAHAGTSTNNFKSIGIAFIGNFMRRDVTNAAWSSFNSLVSELKDIRKLSRQAIIRGHKDLKNTECPGRRLYQRLQ